MPQFAVYSNPGRPNALHDSAIVQHAADVVVLSVLSMRLCSLLMILVCAVCARAVAASVPKMPRAADPNAAHVRRSLTDAEIALIETAVKSKLKDPYSAVFETPIGADKPKLGVVAFCVGVNAKNSYGGYEGVQQVYGVIKNGVADPLFPADIVVTIAQNRLIAAQNEEADDQLRQAKARAAMVGMSPFEQGQQVIKSRYAELRIMHARELRDQQRSSPEREAAAFIAKACHDNVE